MRIRPIHYIFIILIVFIIPLVHAITISELESHYNIYGINNDASGNLILIVNDSNTGNAALDNSTLIKYVINSGSFTPYSALLGGGYIPRDGTSQNLPGQFVTPGTVNKLYVTSSVGEYYFYNYIVPGLTFYGHQQIYRRNPVTNNWVLFYNSAAYTNIGLMNTGFNDGIIPKFSVTGHERTNAFTGDYQFNRYLFFFNMSSGLFEGPFYNSPSSATNFPSPTNPDSGPIYIWDDKDNTGDTYTSLGKSIDGNLNFINTTDDSYFMTSGVVFPNSNVAYAIGRVDPTYPGGLLNDNLYKITNLNNYSNGIISYKINFTSTCQNFFSGTLGATYHNIDCKNSSDCVIVGEWGGNGLAVAYNGGSCAIVDFTSYPTLDTNHPFYTVKYNSGNGQYYIGGEGMFLTLGSGIIPPSPPITNITIAGFFNSNFTSYILSNAFVTNLDGSLTFTNPNGFTGITYNPTTFSRYICPGIASIFIPLDAICILASINFNLYSNNQVGYKVIGTTGSLDPSIQFQVHSDYNSSYFGKVCNYLENVSYADQFNYSTPLNVHGWSTACGLNPIAYSTPGFGVGYSGQAVSLFNDTCLSDLYYDISPVNKNTEFIITARTGAPNVPLGNSSEFIQIGLRSSANQDITPLFLSFFNPTGNDGPDGLGNGFTNGATCLWYAPHGSNFDSLVQLWCWNNYRDWIQLHVYVNFVNKTYTVTANKLYGQITSTFKSVPLQFFSNVADIGKIYINPAVITAGHPSLPPNNYGNQSYIANINIGTYPSLETTGSLSGLLDGYGATDVLFTCTFSDAGTYPTRLYNSLYPNALNNYQDWIAKKEFDFNYNPGTNPVSTGGGANNCGVYGCNASGQPNFGSGLGANARTFLDDILGTNSTSGNKMLLSFFIIVVTIILIVMMGLWANAEFGFPGGAVAGLAFITAFGELLVFTFLGYYPAWLMIIFFIIVAAIIAGVGKMVFASHG